MRLYDGLPYTVTVHGKEYRINPSFDRVIESLEVLKANMLPQTKTEYIFRLLFQGKKPKDKNAAIEAAFLLLFPGNNSEQEKKILDMTQDAALIYCAFLQAYGVDLWEERGKMHWFKFQTLLSGLPSDTALSNIVRIRDEKVPTVTKNNRDYVGKLLRLKQKYAIRLTPEEEHRQSENEISKLAKVMLTMAKEGEEHAKL